MRHVASGATEVRCALAALSLAVVLMLPLAAVAHPPDATEAALGSLVDAEMAFARMSGDRGVRAAFLANFAADGIVFEPGPVRLHDAWAARPPPADPLAVRLDWQPAQAGVARSRDFGYTTGPFRVSTPGQSAAPRHGVYFSAWRRNAAGQWQVIVDAGIATPDAVDFVSFGPAPRPRFKGRADAAAERRALLAREASGFGAVDRAITPTAYAKLLADDARLHRNGARPIVARGAVATEIAHRMRSVTWTPDDARVSASGDIAITFGAFHEIDRADRAHDGHYAHLWLRDEHGRWRLGYDVVPGP